MNTGQTQCNFRHIEFLIDVAEDARDLNKMSATKQRRYNELAAAGLVTLWEDEPYIKLTAKGQEVLGALEDELVRLIQYVNRNLT